MNSTSESVSDSKAEFIRISGERNKELKERKALPSDISMSFVITSLIFLFIGMKFSDKRIGIAIALGISLVLYYILYTQYDSVKSDPKEMGLGLSIFYMFTNVFFFVAYIVMYIMYKLIQ